MSTGKSVVHHSWLGGCEGEELECKSRWAPVLLGAPWFVPAPPRREFNFHGRMGVGRAYGNSPAVQHASRHVNPGVSIGPRSAPRAAWYFHNARRGVEGLCWMVSLVPWACLAHCSLAQHARPPLAGARVRGVWRLALLPLADGSSACAPASSTGKRTRAHVLRRCGPPRLALAYGRRARRVRWCRACAASVPVCKCGLGADGPMARLHGRLAAGSQRNACRAGARA